MQRLLIRAADRICALPLTDVEETMRELDAVPCAGTPAWVRGASVIRGNAVPVVDLAALLGGARSAARGRMVTVRARPGLVALLVDEVLGVRVLPGANANGRKPLLQGAARSVTEELTTLDGKLLAFLDVSEVVSDELHDTIVAGARR